MDIRPPSPPRLAAALLVLPPKSDISEANGSVEESAANELVVVVVVVVITGESNRSGWIIGAGSGAGAELDEELEANGSYRSPEVNGLSARSGSFFAGKGGGTGAAPGSTPNTVGAGGG